MSVCGPTTSGCNFSTVIEQIAVKFCSHIYASWMMYPNNFGDLMTVQTDIITCTANFLTYFQDKKKSIKSYHPSMSLQVD